MKRFLFEGHLPKGFTFPASYLVMMARNDLPDIDPWWFLSEDKELSEFWADTLHEQYPGRTLVPFAKRNGSDDVACFDGKDISLNPKVYYVHAYASPGWEHRGEVNGFDQWLKEAKAESDKYKMEFEE